jgi:hypothetical protein
MKKRVVMSPNSIRKTVIWLDLRFSDCDYEEQNLLGCNGESNVSEEHISFIFRVEQ